MMSATHNPRLMRRNHARQLDRGKRLQRHQPSAEAKAVDHHRVPGGPRSGRCLREHQRRPGGAHDGGDGGVARRFALPATNEQQHAGDEHRERGERVHHSHHHEMPRALRGRQTLTRALAEEDDFDSLQQDQDVEHQAVVLDVVEVVLKLLGRVLL